MTRRRNSWRVMLIVAWAAVAPYAAAERQETIRLGLRDALERARARHVQVIVGSERVQQAIARLQQARSVLWPHLQATTSERRQTKNLDAAGISLPGREPVVGPFNSFDARVTVKQTLFDAAALHRLRGAWSGRDLSLAESQRAKQDAMALVAALYLDAWRATDGIELADAMRQRADARLNLARSRLKLGVGSTVDVTQAEAEAADARRQWHAAFTEALDRRLDVAAALGLHHNQSLVLDAEQPAMAPLPDDRQILSAIATRPDITVAEETVRGRKSEQAAQRAEALPTVVISADYGASGKNPSDFEDTYAMGVEMSVPVFEGGLRAARVREATSQVRESEARLTDAQYQAEADAFGAREAITQADAMLQAAEAELGASKAQLQLSEQRLASGMGSELEVIESRAQAAQARDHHRDALATQQLAQVTLMHALGRVDALLEPGTNR